MRSLKRKRERREEKAPQEEEVSTKTFRKVLNFFGKTRTVKGCSHGANKPRSGGKQAKFQH